MGQNSEEKDSDDKTEEGTEERRNQMREEGNLPNTKDIVGAFALITFLLFFYFYGINIINSFQETFYRTYNGMFLKPITQSSLLPTILYISKPVLPSLFLLFIVTLMFPLLFGLTLTKFNLAFKKLDFDFNKLNPTDGFLKMFGKQSVVELIKSILKLSILCGISYYAVKNEILTAAKYYFYENKVFVGEFVKSITHIFIYLCGGTIAIAAIDYGYNIWKFEQDLRMTKEEIKDEIKKQEGDPVYKSRRRRMARDLILRKSIQEVPKATFIVANPEHFSIAVLYSKGMSAPIVIAKGQDYLALKIREIAKKHDIMIVENKPLARTLYKTVKVGQEIPNSLYQAVIEVMKYIYRMKGKNYFEKRNLLELKTSS